MCIYNHTQFPSIYYLSLHKCRTSPSLTFHQSPSVCIIHAENGDHVTKMYDENGTLLKGALFLAGECFIQELCLLTNYSGQPQTRQFRLLSLNCS